MKFDNFFNFSQITDQPIKYSMKDGDYVYINIKNMKKSPSLEFIPMVEFIVTNKNTPNYDENDVYLEPNFFVKECSLQFLSLIMFSFNYAKEESLDDLEKLFSKHTELVFNALLERNYNYLFQITYDYFTTSSHDITDFQQLGSAFFQKEMFEKYEDIWKILNIHVESYDIVKYATGYRIA